MNRGSSSPSVEPPSNQRMKLTGAAILVSRGMKVLQAAPAAYPCRCGDHCRGRGGGPIPGWKGAAMNCSVPGCGRAAAVRVILYDVYLYYAEAEVFYEE